VRFAQQTAASGFRLQASGVLSVGAALNWTRLSQTIL
jgi:hypothetical protein